MTDNVTPRPGEILSREQVAWNRHAESYLRNQIEHGTTVTDYGHFVAGFRAGEKRPSPDTIPVPRDVLRQVREALEGSLEVIDVEYTGTRLEMCNTLALLRGLEDRT